jgi:hypothetical protein
MLFFIGKSRAKIGFYIEKISRSFFMPL